MVSIRREEPGDRAAVHHVNERAFGRATEANLVDALRAADKALLSLVAVRDNQVIGHILFSPVTIGPGDENFRAAGLAPMAVLPEFQRQGVGSLLIETGLDECRRAGIEGLVVLGHPNYYPRFGFVPASRYGIKCEFGVADEAFMAMELREGAFRNREGTVKYQPEFDQF
ncbi:MAG: N-acetyltransferase [Blastocatellia bacterium]|nr:N-acetyltransferase [Blastocatellia bacterium]